MVLIHTVIRCHLAQQALAKLPQGEGQENAAQDPAPKFDRVPARSSIDLWNKRGDCSCGAFIVPAFPNILKSMSVLRIELSLLSAAVG